MFVKWLFIIGTDPGLKTALSSIADIIVNPDWKIKEAENEINGIEHAGLHMILKKLAQHDAVALQESKTTFGECLCSKVTDEAVSILLFVFKCFLTLLLQVEMWLGKNRGCFLLVAIIENGSEATRSDMKEKVLKFKKLLKKQSTAGAKILLSKIKN